MLPRAYWKGSLKLSLVTCPVALYPASTTVERTRFHMINTETGNRLKQQMVDSETGEVVEKEQKGRGYEVSKGEYVQIEKEELEAVQLESNHTIDIDNFVPRDEIDRRYLDSPYYMVPDGNGGLDAFAVIRDAMKDQDRVALARVVLSNRERIVAIEPSARVCSPPRCDMRTKCETRKISSPTSRHRKSRRTWSNSLRIFLIAKRRISTPQSSRTNTKMR